MVSNIGQTAGTDGVTVGTIGTSQYTRAQQFTTGGNADGYALSEVVVKIHLVASSGNVPRVSIYTASSGTPGGGLYTLTNPATFDSGNMTFTAPANATLEDETPYFVVLEETAIGARFDLSQTLSDDEGTNEGEWSIANTHA